MKQKSSPHLLAENGACLGAARRFLLHVLVTARTVGERDWGEHDANPNPENLLVHVAHCKERAHLLDEKSGPEDF